MVMYGGELLYLPGVPSDVARLVGAIWAHYHCCVFYQAIT